MHKCLFDGIRIMAFQCADPKESKVKFTKDRQTEIDAAAASITDRVTFTFKVTQPKFLYNVLETYSLPFAIVLFLFACLLGFILQTVKTRLYRTASISVVHICIAIAV